ncbi:hypothetical protein JDV09_21110 [Mycobacterium sp. Y57]|uniref:hypothetical protein n=1 Tax=Mycolicibacterium xanthum TaxID=2796469 RepID=UPI001C847F9E|nr:hypothetical protein [Mycolicibacterium xanthum]MBX7434577.1 hypothetical protein [Mycolicibacterium xanthum]
MDDEEDRVDPDDIARLINIMDRVVLEPARQRAARYESFLSDKRKLNAHLLITYRRAGCRCVLLHVLSTPDGVLLGRPPQRPAAGAGRPDVFQVERERDPARAQWLTSGDSESERITLRCPHRTFFNITFSEIRQDLAATRRGATIPLPRGNTM